VILGRGGELERRRDGDAGTVRLPVADGRALAARRRAVVLYPEGAQRAPAAHSQPGAEEARGSWEAYSEAPGVVVLGATLAPAPAPDRSGMGKALVFAAALLAGWALNCFGAV